MKVQKRLIFELDQKFGTEVNALKKRMDRFEKKVREDLNELERRRKEDKEEIMQFMKTKFEEIERKITQNKDEAKK